MVFSYRNEGGEQVDARSPLFAADEQHDYTLTLPAPGGPARHRPGAAVRPAPQINEDTGEVEFPVRGSWVLTATGT